MEAQLLNSELLKDIGIPNKIPPLLSVFILVYYFPEFKGDNVQGMSGKNCMCLPQWRRGKMTMIKEEVGWGEMKYEVDLS
jgi:hypothetical protein